MKPHGSMPARRYARAVEQALSRLHGGPVVLSPADWDLVSGWQERGVPLATILEALASASLRGRGQGRRPPARRLTYIAPAVEEAWKVIRAGRIAPIPGTGGQPVPLTGPNRDWVRAIDEASGASGLRSLLCGLLDRLHAGESPVVLDQELDRGLLRAAPTDLLSRVTAETDVDLEPYRSRMDASAFEATRSRAVTDRLRRALRLPRLARIEPEGD